MNRRRLLAILMLFAGVIAPATGADTGKDEIGVVTVTVYYGTDGDASAAGERAKPVDDEISKRFKTDEKLRFSHYRELGKDAKPLFRSYENWAQPLGPSDEILLRFEAQSRLEEERIRLDLELWLGRKKILKTDASLEIGKPLLVLGPEWRGGRLIISVGLAHSASPEQ